MKKGMVLLGLRNYKKEQYKDISVWTIPGGRCDENEDILATLKREVEEEVGITHFDIIKELGVIPGVKEGDIMHVFLCNTNQEAQLMEPEKFTEWRWFKVDEIPDNFINPRLLEMVKEL